MANSTALNPPDKVTVLKPSLIQPIGGGLLSAFLFFLGIRMLQVGGLSELWAGIPFFGLGGFIGARAVKGLQNRKHLHLELDQYSLSFAGTAVTRKEMLGVQYHKDLGFKGIRIDLLDDRWIGIPHHVHAPRRVLAALRAHGYIVDE